MTLNLLCLPVQKSAGQATFSQDVVEEGLEGLAGAMFGFLFPSQ